MRARWFASILCCSFRLPDRAWQNCFLERTSYLFVPALQTSLSLDFILISARPDKSCYDNSDNSRAIFGRSRVFVHAFYGFVCIGLYKENDCVIISRTAEPDTILAGGHHITYCSINGCVERVANAPICIYPRIPKYLCYPAICVSAVAMIQREVLPGSLCVRSTLLIQVRGMSQEPAVRTHGLTIGRTRQGIGPDSVQTKVADFICISSG